MVMKITSFSFRKSHEKVGLRLQLSKTISRKKEFVQLRFIGRIVLLEAADRTFTDN